MMRHQGRSTGKEKAMTRRCDRPCDVVRKILMGPNFDNLGVNYRTVGDDLIYSFYSLFLEMKNTMVFDENIGNSWRRSMRA